MKAIITALFLVISIIANAQLSKTDFQKEILKGKVKSIKTNIIPIFIDEKKQETLFRDLIKTSHTQYNLQGNKIQTQEYISVDEITKKTLFFYNDKHQLLEEKHYINDSLNKTRRSHYDDNGTITIITRYSDDKDAIVEVYEYNPTKNSALQMVYSYIGFLYKESFLYNKRGQIKEKKTFYEGNKLSSKNIYKYNKNGNEVLFSVYTDDGNLFIRIKSRYLKYDAKGNWTEMKRFLNKEQAEYITREIEYYE